MFCNSVHVSLQFVRGLLELSPSDLAGLMCDPRASHVFTVFGSSQSVGEKSRLALLDRVKVTNQRREGGGASR